MSDQAIRALGPNDAPEILEIINAAAQRYRGAIPDDVWREPYMPAEDLAREMAAGVSFCGMEDEGRLVGVMGVQPVKDVDLIRHAYVRPQGQGRGVGGRLLKFLGDRTSRPILIGTWAAAEWAIRFYEHHGFVRATATETPGLLRTYWNIPDRQIETSVVLTRGLR
ncbi:MAG: acetyltransferase family protein [Caulobacteraceae bacterium]|nr:acetyltransferase family protein [Caulobacteraceae bacterium]